MTTYGTISTGSSPGTSRVEFISGAKERIKAGLGIRRPWREMRWYALSIPPSVSEAVDRVRTNFAYFRMNYAIIVLWVVFLSLFWHPVSLIVSIFTMIAFLFVYFLRDVPVIAAGRTIDDWVVLIVLLVVTTAALLLTHATVNNIIVLLLLGLAMVLVHAVFRKTDDLCLDEEAMGFDGDGLTRPLSALLRSSHSLDPSIVNLSFSGTKMAEH